MTPSIHDVAKRAGVSIATVSRVINHPDSVKEKRRIAVQEAMEFLEYEPNQFGRGLVKQRSNVIGVFFADGVRSMYSSMYDSSYTLELLKGIDHVITKSGYALLIIHEDIYTNKVRMLEYANQKKMDGLIISGVIPDSEATRQRDRLIEMDFPLVYIGKRLHTRGHNVYANYENYMFEMIECLSRSGHRKIAVVVFDLHKSYFANVKLRVMKQLPEVELFTEYIECKTSFNDTDMSEKELLLRMVERSVHKNGCTAMSYPDMSSMNILFGCFAFLGITVPDDLSVIAVEHRKNDGSSFYPEVDSFYVPAEEMGRAAAEQLICCVEGKKDVKDSIEFESRYYKRNTVRSHQ